jgi:hypothetical protein
MDQVYMLMWASDVVSDLKALGVLTMLMGVIAMVAMFFALDSWNDRSDDYQEENPFPKKRWNLIIISLLSFTMVTVFFPGKQTLHMMAAAKAVELGAGTDLGAKGLEAANKVLDKIINETRK